MRRLSGMLGLTAGLLMASLGTSGAKAQTELPRASFTWSTPARFGFDADRDGRIEIENTALDLHNRTSPCPGACPTPRFRVDLRASPSPTEIGLPTSFLTYEWRIGEAVHHKVGPDLSLLLPEGSHAVDLRVGVRLPWGRVTQRARDTIVVEDILIVALGDSYATGDGSPEVPIGDQGEALWADSSDPSVEEQHALAHRSTVGWPVQVALYLEDASLQTSVSLVDLAATGARIDRGILRERTDPPLPAQLDTMADVVQDRTIDVLLLQVGGNDAGFARVIRALVSADPLLDPICYEVIVENAFAAARDGVWDRGVDVTYDPPFDFGCRATPGSNRSLPGLDGLAAEFDDLAAALGEWDIKRVVLVEYPDPTGGRPDGEVCREIAGDVTAPFGFHEVDEEEQGAGVERLLAPLNTALRQAAETHGWEFVRGVAGAFAAGHGYCAEWPDYGYPEWFRDSPVLFRNRLQVPEGWYRVPTRYGLPTLLNEESVSWYRTAAQSAELQGPVPRFYTSGTLHPNEQGHQAIAELVLLTMGD